MKYEKVKLSFFDGRKELAGPVQTRDGYLNGFQRLDYIRHLLYIKVARTWNI